MNACENIKTIITPTSAGYAILYLNSSDIFPGLWKTVAILNEVTQKLDECF